MRLLAVDTSTPWGSVAVVSAAGVEAEIRLAARDGHSRWLLPAVRWLLESLGISPFGLDGFAVAVGPGSFTGLRVGISSVQGLALGTSRPCLGVSSLDVLASLALGSAPRVVAMIDAFRGEVYAGRYDQAGRLEGARRVGRVETLVGELSGRLAFVGDGALRHQSEIEALCPEAVFPRPDLFLAAALGRLALPRLLAGEGLGPDSLRPLYIRGVDIRRTAP